LLSREAALWRAAYTRPHHESKLAAHWRSQGFHVFLPVHQSWRRWSDRKKMVCVPLFPSYVFVQLPPARHAEAVKAPGFLWFVSSRAGMLSVDPRELDAVRALLDSGMAFDPAPELTDGDEVEITKGALRGCRGVLQCKTLGFVILPVSTIRGGLRVRLPDPTWMERRSTRTAACPIAAAIRAIRPATA